MCFACRKSLCLAACVVVLCGGCGRGQDPWAGKRPKVVAAEGIVKHSGDPLAGATIVFVPESPDGLAASAITDSAGRFQLMAFPPQRGAVPGQYKILLTKVEQVPIQKSAGSPAAAHSDPGTAPPNQMLPEKYGNPQSSGLSADIPPEGKRDFLITIN